MLGREVQTISNKYYAPGSYTFTWDAQDFSSGVYFIRLQAGPFQQSKKIVLLK
jgi:hypothetical protein